MSDSRQTVQEERLQDQAAEQAAAQRPASPAGEAAPAPGAAASRAPEGGEHAERDAGPAARPAQPDGAAQGEATADGEAAEVQGDIDELVKTAQQRDEYLALAQRTQADFENYRKRVAREAAAAQERGKAALAKEMLPALDNLDRALEAAANDDPLLEGVRLVRSELGAALARCGIESFSPVGEQFDPSFHEAIATAPQEGQDAKASGTVVEVYQAGYRIGASVIRPARVVVAA
jgi:molecular chaperone GrpE